ncbi:DUF4157 domain-containing protein [Agathobaculum sp. NTUH-O15-33]|uniref:eCIS core domain-containing protein n=1 Tax=Agathobaculum sp. NTUH-O15-33 TaxID=3079302 RepID=UPI00295834B4|nr:DUF4157 domain-containing protein [Agathobaculum sp. NTUH-O15-33]WNX84575.1 DUF4157 domain-containing protein [Agathobaculum sp. NTUH-O15-33]
MFSTVKKPETEVVQKKPMPNRTGIPSPMKQRFEAASGFSLDDVRVHYHSDQPARLHALAYTRGTQVHIAPGQERHLPHELSHVVQQKSGVVQPTAFINHIPVNASPALERQAERGISGVHFTSSAARTGCTVTQRLAIMAQVPLSEGEKVQFDKLIKVAEAEQCGSGAVDYASVRRLLHNDAPEICVNDPYEIIAFLGHAGPEFIGYMTPDSIVTTVKTILDNSEPLLKKDESAHSVGPASPDSATKMQTSWRGAIYLMGCQTGRAYRQDESQPLPPDQESLADKVKNCYNKSISPDVTDVVGTFLRLFAVSEDPDNEPFHGAYIDYTSQPNITALFGEASVNNLAHTPELVQVLRLIHDINGAFGTITKIVNVYLHTNASQTIWPMTGSDSSKMRQSALDYAFDSLPVLVNGLRVAKDKLPKGFSSNKALCSAMNADIKTIEDCVQRLQAALTQINALIHEIASTNHNPCESTDPNWQPSEKNLDEFIQNCNLAPISWRDSFPVFFHASYQYRYKQAVDSLVAAIPKDDSLMYRNYMSLDPSDVNSSISTISMEFSSVNESYHTKEAALGASYPST